MEATLVPSLTLPPSNRRVSDVMAIAGWMDAHCKSTSFKNLSLENKLKLYRSATFATFSQNEVVFKQGDPSDSILVLISGTVDIFRRHDGDVTSLIGEFVVKLDEKGTYIGELGVIESSK